MNEERMIPCDHVIAQLWEYLDGDLDELRSEQVRRHLDVCARCFPEYDFRRAYLKFMRRCSTQQVPAELRRRVFETILEEERKVELAVGASTGTGVMERARHTLRRILGRG
jgi:anti-sigma factor (TIGR02949 family)